MAGATVGAVAMLMTGVACFATSGARLLRVVCVWLGHECR
jgi:hypothetical protein